MCGTAGSCPAGSQQSLRCHLDPSCCGCHAASSSLARPPARRPPARSWLRWRGAKPAVEITIILAVAYLSFYVGQSPAKVSGLAGGAVARAHWAVPAVLAAGSRASCRAAAPRTSCHLRRTHLAPSPARALA